MTPKYFSVAMRKQWGDKALSRAEYTKGGKGLIFDDTGTGKKQFFRLPKAFDVSEVIHLRLEQTNAS